jgi:hypothetical protein
MAAYMMNERQVLEKISPHVLKFIWSVVGRAKLKLIKLREFFMCLRWDFEGFEIGVGVGLKI